jgi:hypothetical protein
MASDGWQAVLAAGCLERFTANLAPFVPVATEA